MIPKCSNLGSLDLVGHLSQLHIRATILYIIQGNVFLHGFVASLAGFCGLLGSPKEFENHCLTLKASVTAAFPVLSTTIFLNKTPNLMNGLCALVRMSYL